MAFHIQNILRFIGVECRWLNENRTSSAAVNTSYYYSNITFWLHCTGGKQSRRFSVIKSHPIENIEVNDERTLGLRCHSLMLLVAFSSFFHSLPAHLIQNVCFLVRFSKKNQITANSSFHFMSCFSVNYDGFVNTTGTRSWPFCGLELRI